MPGFISSRTWAEEPGSRTPLTPSRKNHPQRQPQHHRKPTSLSQDTLTTSQNPPELRNSTTHPNTQKPQKPISLFHQGDHPREEPTEKPFTSLLLDLSPPLFLPVVAVKPRLIRFSLQLLSLLMIVPPSLISMTLSYPIQSPITLLLLIHLSYPPVRALVIVESVLQLLILSLT